MPCHATVIANECSHIFCNWYVAYNVKIYQLTELSLRLKESGYREKIREEIMKRGLEAYEKQRERDTNGICPLHRPKGYDQKERTKKKRRKKTSLCNHTRRSCFAHQHQTEALQEF